MLSLIHKKAKVPMMTDHTNPDNYTSIATALSNDELDPTQRRKNIKVQLPR